MSTTYRKKLIEVALPLDAINRESAREKSIRHGHPSTLHLWWARRPLAACRAVLFSSLVNDPDDDPMHGISEDTAATERAKLFDLIEEMVKWENSNNPRVINAARLEIARSIATNKVADGELEDDTPLVADAPELPEEQAKYLPDPPPEYTAHDVRFKMPGLRPEQVNHFLAHYAPPVLDPFAGGGSIPLEAQRLGLRAYASDLNPVPVLINKALIEIPPKFANMPPVNPDWQSKSDEEKAMAMWKGAQGLAEDVRYYGKWMRDEAEKRIGHLYPNVKVTEEMAEDRPDLKPYVGQELTVIAWIWARTVKSPNPAAVGTHVPLIGSYWLSKKKGKEYYLKPIVDANKKCFYFEVNAGVPPKDFAVATGTKIGRATFGCILSGAVISGAYADEQANLNEMKSCPIAIVAAGARERVYLPASAQDIMVNVEKAVELTANGDYPDEPARGTFAGNAQGRIYGFRTFKDYFTERQLVAISTFSDLVRESIEVVHNACDGLAIDGREYTNAIATYLAFGIDKGCNYWSSLCGWHSGRDIIMSTFGRQAIPMVWDYAEANPLSSSSGNVLSGIDSCAKSLDNYFAGVSGRAIQNDAVDSSSYEGQVIATDPPYYDNINYSDLSDFFYVWLRRSLQDVYPELFGTLLTPKANELIATPYRHDGDKAKAAEFFETGLGNAIKQWYSHGNKNFPTTIFYAFKQAETDVEGTASTGWETFLAGVIEHGFTITATWPMRTELIGNLKKKVSALASSIVLACVPRPDGASIVTRRDFANALRKELPEAIKHLQSGNVAPVDLAQASIGPGMAVFSRYSKVVNAYGSPMSVREALQLINQVLDESLVEQESDFDAETRFALRWFEQYGMTEGPFCDAETLAKAMAVAVSGVVEAGILKAGAGRVRILKREELADDWDPMTDSRLVVWEVTQYLIRTLEQDGEMATAALLGKVGSLAEVARDLAYRLYATCERKKLAQEALAYNSLVIAWPEISRLARQIGSETKTETQQTFLED